MKMQMDRFKKIKDMNKIMVTERSDNIKGLLKNNLFSLSIFMIVVFSGFVIAGDVVIQNGDFSVDTSDFFVNSTSGYVGIGTTTPGQLLSLSSSGTTIAEMNAANNWNAQFVFSEAGTQKWKMGLIGNGDSYEIRNSGNSARLRITSGSTLLKILILTISVPTFPTSSDTVSVIR